MRTSPQFSRQMPLLRNFDLIARDIWRAYVAQGVLIIPSLEGRSHQDPVKCLYCSVILITVDYWIQNYYFFMPWFQLLNPLALLRLNFQFLIDFRLRTSKVTIQKFFNKFITLFNHFPVFIFSDIDMHCLLICLFILIWSLCHSALWFDTCIFTPFSVLDLISNTFSISSPLLKSFVNMHLFHQSL